MSKFIPVEIDEYFFLDIILIFLMINYSMPLATIYAMMVIVGSFMYYVAADQRLFQMIPFARKGGKAIPIAVGIGLGVGFIYFYNWLGSLTPMANVFATTAFGESESIGKLVFGVLIAVVETRFFFRTIMQWFAWKTGMSTRDSLLSVNSIILMVVFGALFTIFHATAKGIENNIDLMATFAFGALSVAVIIYTQQILEAAIMHVVVNGHAVGLFDFILKGGLFTAPVLIGGGVVLFIYMSSKKGRRMPFLT